MESPRKTPTSRLKSRQKTIRRTFLFSPSSQKEITKRLPSSSSKTKKSTQLRRVRSFDLNLLRVPSISFKSKTHRLPEPNIREHLKKKDSFFKEDVLRSPRHPTMKKEPSGLDVSAPSGDQYKIIRSVVMSSDGTLNIESYINEIFNGYFRPNIEFVGFPSTIVVNNSNVIMASQIFDRQFAIEYKNGEYSDVHNIPEYFEKRKRLGTTGITWIGAPSITFNYENREKAKQIINSTANHMMFWLTSFASSACVASANVSQYKYCSRFTKLKDICNDKEKYQIHDTYTDFSRTRKKFITTFDEAIDVIMKEKESIDIYNANSAIESFHGPSSEQPNIMYQRYNELLTYFFPWDIDGIELGLMSEEKIVHLIEKTNEQRNIYVEKYMELLAIAESADNFNYLRTHFKELVTEYITDSNMDRLRSIGYSTQEIIFARFLLYCKCNSMTQLQSVSEQQLKNILEYIIEKLMEPLKVYEYVIDLRTHTGEFIFKGLYDGSNPMILQRTHKFEFFIQEKDSVNKKRTNVYPFEVAFNSL